MAISKTKKFAVSGQFSHARSHIGIGEDNLFLNFFLKCSYVLILNFLQCTCGTSVKQTPFGPEFLSVL